MTIQAKTISFPKSILLTELENKVFSVFTRCKIYKWTSEELRTHLDNEILKPINERVGIHNKHKHNSYVIGFTSGLVYACRRELQKELEFCYMYKDELYSTHKETDKRKTKELYNANLGYVLNDYLNGFYWKNSDKRFS